MVSCGQGDPEQWSASVIARSAAAEGEYDIALQFATLLTDDVPENPTLACDLAQWYLNARQRSIGRAKSMLEACEGDSGNNRQSLLALQIATIESDWKTGARVVDQLDESDRARLRLRYPKLMGEVYGHTLDPDSPDALALWSEMAELFPTDSSLVYRAWLAARRTRGDAQRWAKGLEYSRALESVDNTLCADVMMHLDGLAQLFPAGHADVLQKRIEFAQRCERSDVLLSLIDDKNVENDALRLRNLAQALYRAGLVRDSLEVYARIATRQDAGAASLIEAAQVAIERHQLDLARQWLNTIASDDRNVGRFHYLNGRIYTLSDSRERAIEAMRRAVSLSPWNVEYRNALSGLLADRPEDSDVYFCPRAAVEVIPDLLDPVCRTGESQ